MYNFDLPKMMNYHELILSETCHLILTVTSFVLFGFFAADF